MFTPIKIFETISTPGGYLPTYDLPGDVPHFGGRFLHKTQFLGSKSE